MKKYAAHTTRGRVATHKNSFAKRRTQTKTMWERVRDELRAEEVAKVNGWTAKHSATCRMRDGIKVASCPRCVQLADPNYRAPRSAPHTVAVFEPSAELVRMADDLATDAITRHEDGRTECHMCGEWDHHADGCPMPVLDDWLMGDKATQQYHWEQVERPRATARPTSKRR